MSKCFQVYLSEKEVSILNDYAAAINAVCPGALHVRPTGKLIKACALQYMDDLINYTEEIPENVRGIAAELKK